MAKSSPDVPCARGSLFQESITFSASARLRRRRRCVRCLRARCSPQPSSGCTGLLYVGGMLVRTISLRGSFQQHQVCAQAQAARHELVAKLMYE